MPFLGGRASASRGFFGGGSTPTPPTNLSSIEGNQQLTISFTAPSFNGGLTIGNYEYALSTNSGSSYGAWTALSPVDTSSPIVIGGLTNGQAYHVKLRARNALGGGQESDPLSTNTTPFTVPSAPVISVARQASQTLRITLTTAAAGNGRTVTGYEYRIKSSGSYGSYIALSGTTGPWDIGSLDNGTTYTVQVRGINVGGSGTGSNEPSAIPFTVPDQVGTPTSSSGDRRFTITWSAPGNGGNGISAYRAQYSTNGGASWTGDATPTTTPTSHTFTVENGSSYIGRVQAINAAGNGAYSAASTARTPTFAAPTGLAAANLSGYGVREPFANSTWYKSPFRVTFSPTACENYRDTYVTITDLYGQSNTEGPYTSSAANQYVDFSTVDTWYGSADIGLSQYFTVTVTTYNTAGHGVSASIGHTTRAGNVEAFDTLEEFETDHKLVTGGSMARTYYNWYGTIDESVRSADVYARASQASPTINTVSEKRNPSLWLSSATSSTGSGGDTVDLYSLTNLRASANNVLRTQNWNHTNLNTGFNTTGTGGSNNNAQRYSIAGGGETIGTWPDGQQIDTYLKVNYYLRSYYTI
jgi:hypothetical protein